MKNVNAHTGFLAIAAAASAIPAAVSARTGNEHGPNIVFIITDQQTASAMGCSGNADLHTPNMDRLASAGILFRNAYCSAPASGPSRAAMFTGCYPSQIGMLANETALPDSLQTRTLGNLVRNAGYECAYGGKWHVNEYEIPDGKYGFEKIHTNSDSGLADACVDFLKREHNSPFFLVASFDNPHNICEWARAQNLPYGNVPDADIDECPGLPANFAVQPYDADVIQMERRSNFGSYPTVDYTPDDWRRYRNAYYRLVEKVDAEIGKLIDEIDRQNLWKNTVVIFTSDHGDGNGAHQWNQKSALYEEVVNIPLIVVLPGKENAGTELYQLVNNGVDFFATVCDWTGVTAPEGTSGVSYRRLAEKGTVTSGHQDFIVAETLFDKGTTKGWMLRTADFKYVLYDKGRYREQLFDMNTDKGEMRNLAVESQYAEILQRHRDILSDWMVDKGIKPSRWILNDVPGKSLREDCMK